MGTIQHGKVLSRWRAAKGWTQAQAAEKLGVTQSCWASWEVGRVMPDLGNALEIEKLSDGAVPAVGWARKRKRPRRAA